MFVEVLHFGSFFHPILSPIFVSKNLSAEERRRPQEAPGGLRDPGDFSSHGRARREGPGECQQARTKVSTVELLKKRRFKHLKTFVLKKGGSKKWGKFKHLKQLVHNIQNDCSNISELALVLIVFKNLIYD